MFSFVVLSSLAAVLFAIYTISRRKFNYWKVKKVPHLEPTAILGNYGDIILQRKTYFEVVENIISKFSDEPYVGAYYGTEPALIVNDPEIIKLVMTKDFYYFHGREATKYSGKETFTQNLFFSGWDEWKVTRQNLTPLFSSAKMKNMFPLIEKCSVMFEKSLDNLLTGDSTDVNRLLARYTMACICSCVFGIDIDTLESDSGNSPFIKMGDIMFEISSIRSFFAISRAIWPAIFYKIGLKNFPEKLENFFNSVLINIFQGRNYKATSREDFIDLMLQLKEKQVVSGDCMRNSVTKEGKKVSIPVTDTFMVTQCMLFFGAGFETSATTLSYTLYELAKNPEAQRMAQKEVDQFLKKHENKLVYNCVTEMPYTEACIDEALRLYPVLGVLTREVMDDYTLPSGLTLDKGVRVHIPVYHLQHNPQYFPDPEQYKPERFYGEEKKNIKSYTYMPFGDGGRICIGMRFAKMQMLSGLVSILKKYSVELAEGMPTELTFEPRSPITQPRSKIHLRFRTRPGWEERTFAQ